MASILILHEQGGMGRLLRPVIEEAGHECLDCPDIVSALELLSAASYEIVILDIDSLSDPERAVEVLLKANNRPSVLLLTCGCNAHPLESAIRAGAWDVLCTPFTHAQLQQVVNRCLFHRHAMRQVCVNGRMKREAILGTSPSLEHCLESIATVAQSGASVLILGETGTGKELFAHAIHENSPRAERNFIVVDCTNIPKTLAESLLFGHERGSFTGAAESRDGLFKQADGGTVFLDEIGDLDLEIQKSLLRVLQERRFRPLSARKEVTSDFRLVAATNKDLEDMVRQKTFRKDLYHRLCTRVIHLPPLRERREDIAPIANYHVGCICEELGCPEKEISQDLHQALTLYDWPGNVRELINTLHATVHNGIGERRLYPQHLPLDIRARVLLKRANETVNDINSTYMMAQESTPFLAEIPATNLDSVDGDLLADPGPKALPACLWTSEPNPACAGQQTSDLPGCQAIACDNAFALQDMNFQSGPNPVNGSELFTAPALATFDRTKSDLPPLRAVRETAMHAVEAVYLRNLVACCQGNFQRALSLSGLSRARLYDLLNKHGLTISSF